MYNVTVNIDFSVHDEWLQWMKEVHIPDVLNTGCFVENKICKVLSAEEEGGKTYAIMYLCPDMPTFNKYQTEFAPKLQQEHTAKFADKFGAFRTILEVVHHTENG